MENNVDVVAMAVDRSEEFKMPTFNRGHQFQLSADFHKQPHEERGGEYGMLQHQHQPWVPAPNQRVVHGCRIGGLPKEVGRTDGGVISVAADASTQGFEPGSKGTVESIATHPAVMTFSGAYAHEHIEIPDNDEASILELLLPTATASTTASTPMVTTLPMPQEDCLLMPPPPPRQPQQPFGSQSQYDYQGPQPPRREQQQQPLNVAASTHFYPLPQSSTYQNADILMLQSVPHHSQRQPQMPSRPLQPQLHSPPQLNPTSGTQPQPYTGLSQSQLPQQPQQPQQPQPHLPGIQPKLEPRPYLQPHPHRHLVSLATATAATPSEMFQKQMMIRRAQDLFLQGPPPLPPSQRKLHLHQQRPQQPPNVRQPFQHQQYHLPTWQNWLQEGQRWLQRGHDHRRQWLQQGEDLQRDWDQQAKMLEGEWREAQRRSMPSSFRQSRSTHQRQNCGQLLPWPASLRQEWDRQGQAMRSAWVQKGYELRELWLEEGEAWMTSRGGVQNNQTQGKIPSLLQGTTSRPDQQCDQEDEDMSGARGGLGTGLRAGPFQILQQVGRRLLVEGREMGNEWMEELRRLERVHQAGGNGQGNGDIVMMD
ncbi:hypothetical protein HK102_007224 [Quaeritorhiza haematococci]|nr:hypothetical protein HK102_007224 [Quaeritorhiza haematococci]